LFPNKETSIFVKKKLKMVERFEIEILEEAADFLDKLDEKSRDKIIYNITKAKFIQTKSYSKS